MPQRTLRPCLSQPCSELVSSGRCAKHRAARYHTETHVFPTREKAFYSTREWRACRNAYLAEHPLCVYCEREGVVRVADEVDHIVPIARGGAKLEWSNLQGLCTPHHSAKTRREMTSA